MTSPIETAFITILRPVIKIMLKQGVDVAAFMALARLTYVQVAQDGDFALKNAQGKKRKITISRIAMLTGINRKEVKSLIEEKEVPRRQTSTNRAVRVVGGWLKDDIFLDKDGEPRVLPYEQTDKDPGFEGLVKKYSADTTPRVILDELINVGSAKWKDECVFLVEKGYVPILSDEKMLEEGSSALRDLANTVEFNLVREKDTKSRLQLTVAYTDVPSEGKNLYKSILKKDATDFINQQNKVLSSLDKTNNSDLTGLGKHRVGVGIYYLED